MNKEVFFSVIWPVRELKGFQRVNLEPGQSRQVDFDLSEEAFSYWSPAKKAWIVEPDVFEIEVGTSSRDIKLDKVISF